MSGSKEGGRSPSVPPFDLALAINEIAPFHLFFLFQTIMEQFNPCLRNFVAMGKNYEKALASKSFFYYLFSLCFSLKVQALGQGLCLALSLSRSSYLWAILFCRKKDIYPSTEGLGLITQCTASYMHLRECLFKS